MRLYWVVIRLFRALAYLYFAEVRASGRENLPGEGPVLIAANHPASVLDGFVLATQVPRMIHYLATSLLFRWRPVGALLRALGAIPVYRRGEGTGSADRNVEVFGKVFELFEAGGCVGIFPEGRNSPPGEVAPLRTGAARMALGAEARNDYRLGLEIVPVGINFASRELLMSSVVLRFGEPIRVADYAGMHREDPEAAVDTLTEDVRSAIQRQALYIEDRSLAELAVDLSAVFGHELPQSVSSTADAASGRERNALKRWFWALLARYRPRDPQMGPPLDARMQSRERINEVLTRLARSRPEALAELRRQVDRYRDHVGQTELHRDLAASLDRPMRQRLLRLRMTIYAVLAAPIALLGLVHNVVPYTLTRWLGARFDNEATQAFGYFGIGVLAFTVTYACIGTWLWQNTAMTAPWIFTYLALLPPTGVAALSYRRTLLLYRDQILVRTFLWDDWELAELLRRERDDLMARFRALAAQCRE